MFVIYATLLTLPNIKLMLFNLTISKSIFSISITSRTVVSLDRFAAKVLEGYELIALYLNFYFRKRGDYITFLSL